MLGQSTSLTLTAVIRRCTLFYSIRTHLPSCNGADDQEGLLARRHRLRKGSVGRFVRQIFFAGEEAQERPALLRHMIADGALQHRITRFKSIEHRTLRNLPRDIQLHLAADPRQGPKLLRNFRADLFGVCPATEGPAGRPGPIGAQVSPAPAAANPGPPVVPKYTPHLSKESTAI